MKASCVIIYPLYPSLYSTRRKTDRTRIRTLTVYRPTRMVSQLRCFQPWLRVMPRSVCDLEVGWREMRKWKTVVTTTKKPKKRSWMTRPPIVTFEPVSCMDAPADMRPPPIKVDFVSLQLGLHEGSSDLVQLDLIYLPAHWRKKEKTSPVTKIFVIHFTGTKLRFSARRYVTVRPKTM